MLHPPHRVLQEHDGVVDEEADGQRQGHERQVVQAVTEHPHGDEGQQQRKRHRHGGNQRVGGPAQEEENHHHHQHEGDEQRFPHVLDAVDDRLRAVVDRHQQHRAGQLAADQGQQVADALGHFHRVRSRLPEHGHHDRGRRHFIAAGPEPHVHPLVLHGIDRPGHVAEVDRQPALRADDELVVLLGPFQLAVRAQERGAAGAVELARPRVARAVADGVGQVIDRNPAGRHRRGIGLDAHRRLRAVDIDAAHARQDADALADLRAAVVVDLAGGDRVARQPDVHDRLVVGIGLGKGWRRGQIDGQAARGAIDRRLHVGGGRVDVLLQGELEREGRVTLVARARDDFQAVDLHELPFQRRGDIVGHRLRARAGIRHPDLDYRVIDGRQIVHRQLQITKHAEEDHREGEDRGHHRAANERFREVHGSAPTGFTVAPGTTA